MCAALPVAAAQLMACSMPDGSMQVQIASHADPGCASVALPLDARQVDTVLPVPAGMLASSSLLVTSKPEAADGERRTIMSAGSGDGAGTGSMPPVLPMESELLSRMRLQIFGAEERVRATLKDGQLRMTCRPGARPAGVILSDDGVMPLADLVLALRLQGRGRFELLAADADLAQREAGTRIGWIDALGEGQSVWQVALPMQGWDRSRWRHFSIACGTDGGELNLSSFCLMPDRSRPAPARAAWQWDAAEWRQDPDSLLRRARGQGMRALFVSVPVTDGAVADAPALARFIRAAARDGIAVWSVDGDPRMVMPAEQPKAVARAKAYASYNARNPGARLAGMQFDVEPYLLPAYALAEADWDARYLALVRALAAAGQGTGSAGGKGLPLEMVVPYWWHGKQALLRDLAPHVASLNVMDYRTRHDEIYGFAAPFLDWGQRFGKQVRIALEAGRVAPERHERYAKAERGDIWLVGAGSHAVLLHLGEALPNPSGPSFAKTGEWLADGSATSFHQDAEGLMRLLPELESQFSAWSSFGGMAVHGLD
ncbi:hypothetical protein [Noviherbaspirillum galbum]|uniref:Uncharacterized protein n=1 Tax=Noviherbaspirillum galbum TaxID=2709383 RepID=A0A6B3SI53_9BURK|nr:hypothetical protein [Noviherbaspirillum galbum]NEX60340.1 hypothetical protein [Noviherbaspirillum galbum]